jgi:hypothetical protein
MLLQFHHLYGFMEGSRLRTGAGSMSADSSNEFISILDEKIDMLRHQLSSEQGPVSCELQQRIAAALRIRERFRLTDGSGLQGKPIDVLGEWCRWERDALAFEAKP